MSHNNPPPPPPRQKSLNENYEGGSELKLISTRLNQCGSEVAS